MKKLRWQLIIIFLTGLVVGILLLGEQPDLQALVKPEPIQGGVYTEAIIGNFQRLNPILDFYNPADRAVNRLIFSGLVKFDERGLAHPDLAESWGVSQDGRIYNFSLRPDLKWHDGFALTSEDVAFTIQMMREGNDIIPQDIKTFWNNVEVKIFNETNFQFILPEPFAPFLDYLSVGILPQHLLGDLSFELLVDAPFNLQPVGSGPYRFEELIIEDNEITGIVLSINDTYYDSQPYIEQVIFRYFLDAQSALVAYQNDTVQGISEITPDILKQALAEPDLSIYSGRKPEVSFIMLNLDNPEVAFFEDKEVRFALMSGLNRQWIIDRLYQGQAVVIDSPILPGTWAYYDGIEHFSFDTQAANNRLKDAGYLVAGTDEEIREKDGVPLQFTVLYPDDELHAAVAQTIQENWSRLNILVNIEAVPYDQLVNERLALRDYQAALVDINLTRSPDPDPYPFWSQVQATGGQNYSQWNERMASEYLEQARITHDITERARLYHNFQVLFNQELPSLPLYYSIYNYGVDSVVQGVNIGPLFDSSDRLATITNWYLEAKLPSLFQSTAQPESQ